jgi:hypothetical protein
VTGWLDSNDPKTSTRRRARPVAYADGGRDLSVVSAGDASLGQLSCRIPTFAELPNKPIDT